MNKLVSIITPCFNAEDFISDTILSVQNQTYANWELLITDDGSTDYSIKIIREFIKNDDRIKLFEISNSGAAVARNNSIKNAEGNFIAFVDSDDLWLPKKLELQLKFMIDNNYNFTYTSYKRIDEKGFDLNITMSCEKQLTYQRMLYSNKIGCLTVIYNKDNLGKIFMPLIKKRQDYALWLKILKIENRAFGLNLELAKYRIRKSSMSKNKFEMLKWNWMLYKKIEKFSYIKALYYLLSNIIIKIKKG